jgi:cytochrome c
LSAKIGFSARASRRFPRGANVVRGKQDHRCAAGGNHSRHGLRHSRRPSDTAGNAGQERLSGRRQRNRPAGPEPIGPLLASASVDAGKNDTKVCTACHTFDKGQPNRIGPNLYGVVGDEIAHDRGNFDFSTALKTAGAGKTWTPDLLNEWLFKPQNFARGTKMTYVGDPKAKDRADIIAYLNSLSDSPKKLEAAPAPAPASAPSAPAKPGAASTSTAPAPASGKPGAAPTAAPTTGKPAEPTPSSTPAPSASGTPAPVTPSAPTPAGAEAGAK